MPLLHRVETMVGKGNPLEILETFFKRNELGGGAQKKISKSDIKPETGNFLRPFEIRGVIRNKPPHFQSSKNNNI